MLLKPRSPYAQADASFALGWCLTSLPLCAQSCALAAEGSSDGSLAVASDDVSKRSPFETSDGHCGNSVGATSSSSGSATATGTVRTDQVTGGKLRPKEQARKGTEVEGGSLGTAPDRDRCLVRDGSQRILYALLAALRAEASSSAASPPSSSAFSSSLDPTPSSRPPLCTKKKGKKVSEAKENCRIHSLVALSHLCSMFAHALVLQQQEGVECHAGQQVGKKAWSVETLLPPHGVMARHIPDLVPLDPKLSIPDAIAGLCPSPTALVDMCLVLTACIEGPSFSHQSKQLAILNLIRVLELGPPRPHSLPLQE